MTQLRRAQSTIYDDIGLSYARKVHELKEVYAGNLLGRPVEAVLAQPDLTAGDLELYRRAAALMAFYTNDPAYASRLQAYVNALAQRGSASTRSYEQLYRSFVGTREFERARALLETHPQLAVEPLGPITENVPATTTAPTVLAFVDKPRHIVHQPAALTLDQQILIVASPLCHFTQNVVRDLVRHPGLWRTLTANALWLAPQDGRLHASAFRSWNKAIPRAGMVLAYKASQWPMIDYWGTPTFYFIRHGKVVDQVVGWPEEGHLEEIVRGMHAIGLDGDAPLSGAASSATD